MILVPIGKSGSGKDTLARALPNFFNFKFSDSLKKMCDEIFNTEEFRKICPQIAEGDFWNDRTPLHRFLLQRVGTDIVRKIDYGYWTDRASELLDKIENDLIVTDCRFPNELDLIIHKARPNERVIIFQLVRGGQLPEFNHPSEKFDWAESIPVVDNNGTVEELVENVLKLMRG